MQGCYLSSLVGLRITSFLLPWSPKTRRLQGGSMVLKVEREKEKQKKSNKGAKD